MVSGRIIADGDPRTVMTMPPSAFRWYEAARRLGLDIDILRPGDSLNGYALVLAPSLPIVSEATEAAFAAADGVAVFGPRSGSKTRQVPPRRPAAGAAALAHPDAGDRSRLDASWRSKIRERRDQRSIGALARTYETDARVLARFADGWPVLVAEVAGITSACGPIRSLVFADELRRQEGRTFNRRAAGKRGLRRRGALIFAFNYGVEPWPAPFAAAPILGGPRRPAQLFRVADPGLSQSLGRTRGNETGLRYLPGHHQLGRKPSRREPIFLTGEVRR